MPGTETCRTYQSSSCLLKVFFWREGVERIERDKYEGSVVGHEWNGMGQTWTKYEGRAVRPQTFLGKELSLAPRGQRCTNERRAERQGRDPQLHNRPESPSPSPGQAAASRRAACRFLGLSRSRHQLLIQSLSGLWHVREQGPKDASRAWMATGRVWVGEINYSPVSKETVDINS
jgi:hypothetical protein